MRQLSRAAVSRGAVVPLIAALVAAGTGTSWTPSSSQIQDAKAQAAALTAKLAQLQSENQAAAANYQAAENQVQQTQANIAATRTKVAAEQARLKLLRKQVSAEALSLFEQSGSTAPFLAIMQGGANSAAIVQEDVSTASSIQQQAVTSYQMVKQQLQSQLLQLGSLEKQQQAAVKVAAQDQASIEANVTQAQSQLAAANQQVAQLVAQQQAAAAAAAAAAEQAAAAAAAQRTPPPPPPPPPPATTPASLAGSGYANPFRAIGNLGPERIDQGVDYSGSGPVYAIGNGIVESVYNSGWPPFDPGVFIVYQLTSGPAAGDYVYVAENINPTVQVGQVVNSGTVIGNMYSGQYGIETGWANGALGDTMAMSAGEWSWQQYSTGYGINFSNLLWALGAPPGYQNGQDGGAPGMPNW